MTASLDRTTWHSQSVAEATAALAADPSRGLTKEEAYARLARYGANQLTARRQEPWWEELVESLREPLQLLLLAVGVVYALVGKLEDAITIFVVIFLVAGIEVVNELRAKRAIAALSTLSAPTAVVVRDGEAIVIPAESLVPGDSIFLGPGDRVPADARLVETSALRIDEASLTGESTSVLKEANAVLADEAEIGERRTMGFAGSVVVAGKGRGLVVATGPTTELGQIAGLAEQAREPRTPLQMGMRQLSGWLIWVAFAFSTLVPIVGLLLADLSWRDAVLTGLTLAFATIPEELPILITIVLGLGAFRLSQNRAIVKRLQAAETLGSVSVVATDKTGTLTCNEMRIVELFFGGPSATSLPLKKDPDIARLLEIGVLANDAQVTNTDSGPKFLGDPTETAFLKAVLEIGLDPEEMRARVQILVDHPFDDVRKRMSVVYQRDGNRFLAMKGAPESVLPLCIEYLPGDVPGVFGEAELRTLQLHVDAMAADGLRVLALAGRKLNHAGDTGLSTETAENDLTFFGLVGLEDPPREEARAAVEALNRASVRVIMLTGDHPTTALAIAAKVGINSSSVIRGRDLEAMTDDELSEKLATTSVFARIAPAHKLRIVRALQSQGEVVAVTGDGVNDAPALREAAIGVAMGQNGTAVAREAADLVLADDNFATITFAVRTGRVLYANLRKAVRYYLAAKVALVTASLAAVLVGLPVPFQPVQIILMELFMDLGASITFISEPPEEDVMASPPRDSRQPFMDRSMHAGIIFGGLMLAVAVLCAYFWTEARADVATAQSAAFVAWMIGHVVLAANMRAERQPFFKTNPFANPAFLLWVTATLVVVALGLTVPFVEQRLHLQAIPSSSWLLILATATIPFTWEIWKWTRLLQSGKPSFISSE